MARIPEQRKMIIPRACSILSFMWIAAVLAHLFTTTGYSIVLRGAVGGKKTDPIFLAGIMSTALAIPAVFGVIIAPPDWSLFDTRLAIFYAIRIALTATFHIVNAKAMEYTEASTFSFIYNIRLGFAAFFGIFFLGEPFVPLQLVGGALVFAAGFVLTGLGVASPKGFSLSLLTALVFAVFTAFEKYLIFELGYSTYMFPSALIVCAATWAIVFIGRYPVDKEFLKSPRLGTLMVFRSISGYGFTIALAFGALLSVTTYISALSCVTTPIAALVFLNEKDSPGKKALAGIIALAGTTLIFIAAR